MLMDQELEETDEVIERHVHSSSSSDNEDDSEKTEVTFWATAVGDSSNVFYFTGTPNGVNRSTASYINAESSPFSILIFFQADFSNYSNWNKLLLSSIRVI
jgi:hypothetical protein